MRLKLKQYFCMHGFTVIADHESTQQTLYKCWKCDVYRIEHRGINVGYYCKEPNIDGWIYKNK